MLVQTGCYAIWPTKYWSCNPFDCYTCTYKEASTVLCSVVKHLWSVRALKKWGKTRDCVTCFPLHFFRSLPLPACFTTEQSTVETSLFVKNILGRVSEAPRFPFLWPRLPCNIPFSFWAKVFNRTRFIESTSGVFPHLERRKYAYIMSISASTLLLRSTFPFEQELRIARV